MIALDPARLDPPTRLGRRIGWTRGAGCREITELLGGEAIRMTDDLATSAVANRIDLLVTRTLSRFNLVPVVVPHRVDLGAVTLVAAAVAGGPHSPFAAAIADEIAAGLHAPLELVTVNRPEDDPAPAHRRLEDLAIGLHAAALRTIAAADARCLVDDLAPGTLLVVGAPGGSWVHRQLFGAGRRLVSHAPAGAVVVQSSPRRCFQEAVEPHGLAVGVDLAIGCALSVTTAPVLAVTDGGALVGLVRRSRLEESDPRAAVGTVMEPPVSVPATATLAAAPDVAAAVDGGPVPVVDRERRLVGMLPVIREVGDGR